MKAFILAAGNGTRLYPLTAHTPKCLVPICGVPILKLWLDLCRTHGIDEVTVNLHAHAAAVREFLMTCPAPPAVRLFQENVLLGSAGTLRANADWVGAKGNFFVFYGDVLTNLDLTRMLSFHRAKGQPVTIALHEVDNPYACGIASMNEQGIVYDFVEKPLHPRSNLGFTGVMIASPEVLKEIPPHAPADIGFHLLPKLVGRMSGYVCNEYLTDIGTLAAYEEAQSTWPGLRADAPFGFLVARPTVGGVEC
jgi:mannose-1-phosphate guanylyltransferase